MADVSQCSIGSVPPISIVKDSAWKTVLRFDERLPVQDFDLKASCPVCQRADGLLKIGDTTFCASCGYASEGAGGCT